MIEFTIPIRLVCSANSREHWRVIAKRKAEQRSTAKYATLGLFGRGLMVKLRTPYKITITRIGKRRMDDDNLAGTAKYLRDGIADALGIDDGDETAATWHYSQEIGNDYGARIQIE